MSDLNITIPGGESRRLLTGGKFCKDDIVVTATGSGGDPFVTERWTFTLMDDSVVEKDVMVR